MDKKFYVDFLKESIHSLEILNNISDEDMESFQNVRAAIINKFEMIKKARCQEEFWQFIIQQYGETPQDLLELLKYLYEITKDAWFACWQNETVLMEIDANMDNYYLLLQLRMHQQHLYFPLYRRLKRDDDWNMNRYFQSGMQELLKMDYPKIPVRERNQDCIVITTTQLLGINHAPSRIALEFSYVIKKYLKKRVLLLSTIESLDYGTLKELGLGNEAIFRKSYLKCYGSFKLRYKEISIDCYQIILEEKTRAEQRALMNSIYNLKPLCVWHLGTIPAFASAMQQFTSVFYTPMHQGYPAVPVDLVVNYFKDAAVHYPEESDFLHEHGIPVADMYYSFPRPAVCGTLKRKQFQISEKAFCLGVAGNRMTQECTDEFIEILADVLQKETEVQIVFIGNIEKDLKEKIVELTNAPDRCFFIGYQDAIDEALALIDLYVDLPHQGGGYIGVSAMYLGKPVVCLRGGDVSSKLGDEWCCETLDEYADEIIRFINDADYYKSMSARAKEKEQNMVTSDEELAELIEKTIYAGVHQEVNEARVDNHIFGCR